LTLETLTRREASTRLGVVPIWSRPDIFDSRKPLVVAIAGAFAGPEDLSRLAEVLSPMADAALLHMPGIDAPPLSDPSIEAFSTVVGELIDELFAGRRVVVLGVSIGAVAALGVRSRSVRRIVAVEPLLATAGLWPMVDALRSHLANLPANSPIHPLFERLFGVTKAQITPRDYRHVLDGLSVPVDVVLAGEPLQPRRRVERLPSLVDAPERALLSVLPQVRMHLAQGAGHNVQGQAPKALKEVLFEACRRGSADPAYDARGLDEALVEAVPLTAARVVHWGPGGRAFAGAYLSWNPAAEVNVLGEDPAAGLDPAEPDGLDAVVLGAPPARELLARLAAALRPGGILIARWSAGAAGQALSAAGLGPGSPVDAGGTGVLRARKTVPGEAPAPPMRIETAAFASYLMDVRTRLPARGLRADPDLIVEYVTPPYTPPPLACDAPKVLVLQRPSGDTFVAARGRLAYAIARGWLLVLEYDDHPALVAEALGRPFDPEEMQRFGQVHAVQTTTETLAAAFRPFNPEVKIFENAVFELAPFPQGPPPRRVFYGAISRGGFGVEVARALAPVVAEFPDLEFVVLGDRAVFDALPTANKAFEDYLPYEAYLARMAGCAVSLSPIEALPLRDTKSDAKFLDAARAGVVTLASPLIYERTIRHGVNGLLARTLEDWPDMLRQALAEPERTRAMGRAAWDYVRAQRMFARQIPERAAWCRDLWARREALNAAAFARVPGLAEAVAAETAQLRRPPAP
jgi:hypothetical protein